jgi:hypothetical protein
MIKLPVIRQRAINRLAIDQDDAVMLWAREQFLDRAGACEYEIGG